MNVGCLDGLDGDESDVMEPAVVLEERSHLLLNVVESFLLPFHSPHLGHHCDQLDHSQSFSQHSVLLCLPFFLKTRLELPFLG
jgi:hypothetical protein